MKTLPKKDNICMSERIQSLPTQSKHYFSNRPVVRDATTPICIEQSDFIDNPRYLPLLHNQNSLIHKLAKIFFEDNIWGAPKSNRSIYELAWRFRCHPKHISRVLCELESMGILATDGHNGRAFKYRWITLWGFTLLEDLLYMHLWSQKKRIPYIYLSDSVRVKNNSYSKKQIVDNSIVNDAPKDEFELYESIVEHLKIKGVGEGSIDTIVNAFKRSSLPLVNQIALALRVFRATTKRWVWHWRAYFLGALSQTERSFKTLRH